VTRDRPLDAETQRRLRWRCRRGLLEVDLLLQRFAASALHTLSVEEGRGLEALIEHPDAVILEWLLGREPAPSPELAHVVGRIRDAAPG
jgi:antitoxin CptB